LQNLEKGSVYLEKEKMYDSDEEALIGTPKKIKKTNPRHVMPNPLHFLPSEF